MVIPTPVAVLTRHSILLATAACASLTLGACTAPAPAPADRSQAQAPPAPAAHVSRAPFGKMPDGTPIEIFTLTSAAGMEVRSMPYGATIVSLRVPDRSGRISDVALGFDTFDDYNAKNSPYLGVVPGRYANRIAKGRFTLDGKTYKLATNNGPNHLHGGVIGFDKKLWHAEPFERSGTAGVVYTLTSHDGDEGYPGTLTATVTYSVSASNALTVDYEATTDRATPVNLTQHTYFNLAGEGAGDILGHVLTIDADRFTPVDDTLIPTGALAPVEHTPFDFRTPTAIGARIEADDVQLKRGNGYDHNFVLDRTGLASNGAARVVDGRQPAHTEVLDDRAGLQLYTANCARRHPITGKAGHH